MKPIVLILFLIFLLVIFIGIVLYYYKLINRFLLLIKKDINKHKNLYKLLSIILSLLSINMFTTIGLFLMHFILISLVIDLIYLIIRKISKKKYLFNIYNSSIIPLILTIIVIIYGLFNIRNIVETRYTIYTDKNIGEDIRILFISDSHYGDVLKEKGLNNIKGRLNKVDADIVILGGDIVDEETSKDEMEYIFSVFGDIKNKYGIYYVYGNHDRQQYSLNSYYSNDDLEKTILNNGINIISDSYVEVTDSITLLGREDYSFIRKNIKDFSNGIDKSSYLIMIDHQPVKYEENVENNIDLIVSGHTHGGQIFPVEFFINLLHTADLSYGYKDFNGMDAIVSSGLVGWGYPIRTSRNSEYVVIAIKQSK